MPGNDRPRQQHSVVAQPWVCAWLRPHTVRVPSRKSRQIPNDCTHGRATKPFGGRYGRWRTGGKHLSMRRLVAETGELGEDHSECTSDQQLQPGVVEEGFLLAAVGPAGLRAGTPQLGFAAGSRPPATPFAAVSGPEAVLTPPILPLIPTNRGVETISAAPPAKRARPHRAIAAEHRRCRLQLSVAAPKTRQGRRS
jgi:hypothetical protein